MKSISIAWAFGICLIGAESARAWEVVPTGTTADLRGLQFIGPDTGYVTGDAGTVLRTLDGGSSWTPATSPAPVNLGPSYFLNGRTGWVVGGGAVVYRTTNGGSSWTMLSQAPGVIRALAFANPDTGWVTILRYDSLHVLRTHDGGISWSSIYKSFGGMNTAVELPSTISLFQGTAWIFAGVVRIGSLGGTTTFGWNLKAATPGDTLTSHEPGWPWKTSHFSNKEIGWIAAGVTGQTQGCGHYWCPPGPYKANRILKTTDGGLTWSTQLDTTYVSSVLTGLHFWGKDTGYAVGEAGLVLQTLNGGATWLNEAPPTSGNLNAVAVVSPTRAFAAGAGGVLLRTDPSVPIIVGLQTPKVSRKGIAGIVAGTLRYRLPYATSVSLRIVDLQGKMLWQRQSVQAPGDHSLSLPLASLPPGNYFVEFQAGGLRESLRFTTGDTK
jgi:photosystem II stability/assembly factor-like uncharacterized protein